jgi:hypothetical protein
MKFPEKGFYRHYKHNPEKGFNDYVYEVIGIALHSEEKTYMVAYRPVYENSYLAPANFSVRPLDMFLEDVEVNGKTLPRFEHITEQKLIEDLLEIKNKMYENK